MTEYWPPLIETNYPTRSEYFQGQRGYDTYEEYLYECGLITKDIYDELMDLLDYRRHVGNDKPYYEFYEERLYQSSIITEEVYHLLIG